MPRLVIGRSARQLQQLKAVIGNKMQSQMVTRSDESQTGSQDAVILHSISRHEIYRHYRQHWKDAIFSSKLSLC